MPAGLAVGCASPIKNLLFGEDPPLEFLTESLNTMAAAMIPSMMLVLGSVLHKGPGSAKVPIKIILGVLGVRQILIPFLGVSLHPHAVLGRGGQGAHFRLREGWKGVNRDLLRPNSALSVPKA